MGAESGHHNATCPPRPHPTGNRSRFQDRFRVFLRDFERRPGRGPHPSKSCKYLTTQQNHSMTKSSKVLFDSPGTTPNFSCHVSELGWFLVVLVTGPVPSFSSSVRTKASRRLGRRCCFRKTVFTGALQQDLEEIAPTPPGPIQFLTATRRSNVGSALERELMPLRPSFSPDAVAASRR